MPKSIPALYGELEPQKIYPVTEDELKVLEIGSDSSIYLNFAIALITSAISALIAFITVKDLSLKSNAIIFSIIFIGFIGGILLIILWDRSNKSNNSILKKIRARIDTEKLTKEKQEKIPNLVKLPHYQD